jgi:putative tryptophan/tyrosine transport system substrate-binding protein
VDPRQREPYREAELRLERRRALCVTFALAMVVRAQAAAQSPPVPRIGFLGWANCDAPPFLRGLEELGYRPGETAIIECRTAGRHDVGLAPAAAELVQLGVDVIVTLSQPGGRRTK